MQTASFLNDLIFSDEKVVITPLLQTPYSKEIRIAFKKGQIMKEHNAPAPISVMVVTGSIEFGVNDHIFNLNSGDIISLEPSVMHSLKALEQSVVRLTLSKQDSVQRVNAVLNL